MFVVGRWFRESAETMIVHKRKKKVWTYRYEYVTIQDEYVLFFEPFGSRDAGVTHQVGYSWVTPNSFIRWVTPTTMMATTNHWSEKACSKHFWGRRKCFGRLNEQSNSERALREQAKSDSGTSSMLWWLTVPEYHDVIVSSYHRLSFRPDEKCFFFVFARGVEAIAASMRWKEAGFLLFWWSVFGCWPPVYFSMCSLNCCWLCQNSVNKKEKRMKGKKISWNVC